MSEVAKNFHPASKRQLRTTEGPQQCTQASIAWNKDHPPASTSAEDDLLFRTGHNDQVDTQAPQAHAQKLLAAGSCQVAMCRVHSASSSPTHSCSILKRSNKQHHLPFQLLGLERKACMCAHTHTLPQVTAMGVLARKHFTQ